MSKNLAAIMAKEILDGFNQHYRIFKQVAGNAKIHFEKAQWHQLDRESTERISLYDEQVYLCVSQINQNTQTALFDEHLWAATKHAYINLIAKSKQPELAETFYNSVFCKLFDKRFYKNDFIFVTPVISTEYIDIYSPVVNSFYVSNGQLQQRFADVLLSFDFTSKFQDFNRDVMRLVEQFGESCHLSHDDDLEIQMISSAFFRRKSAYLIGRIICRGQFYPIAIGLLNDDKMQIYVDALLLETDDVSVLFSFSRSYFLIQTDYPASVVNFIKTILPNKTKADLYSAIGLHKQGKTLLYRMFLQYTNISDEKLIAAPGIKGMVMSVFTFPMYPYVFKVINDSFAPPKNVTKALVKEKYHYIKNHVKIGRLADTWEFSNVAFPLAKFDSDLLAELKQKIPSSIRIEYDLLIIKHLYIENKMIPLNLYLEQANDKELQHIVYDFGESIDEIINAGIFPGDMLTKNFGVTRQNRVVFYDYDEITPMSVPVFRKIPPPRFPEDEMSAEPWYHVGENDIFPEEFETFVLHNQKVRKLFKQHYQKLLEKDYWQQVQSNIQAGELPDYFPYGEKKRMRTIYKECNHE